MNSYRSTNQSLKYQRFAPSGCKNIGIQRFEFVAKSQFLSQITRAFEKCPIDEKYATLRVSKEFGEFPKC